METKKASRVAWKHLICCIVLLIIFVLTIGIHINAEGRTEEYLSEASDATVPLRYNSLDLINYSLDDIVNLRYNAKNEVELAGPKKEVNVNISDIDNYITTYKDEIAFFAKTFSVKYEDVLADLKERYASRKFEFEQTNVGFLLNKNGEVKKYDSVLYGLVEYFYDYVENNPRKVNKKRVPYTGDAKYVENLIIYFTTHIYTNVDTATALSIGAAESGYYKVKYMLKCNNVFGGMSSKGLIKYRNIEYGVLSYIRLLSKNYYGKGLNTISKIGRKYCPKYDSFGNKIASPHWIKLVSSAMKKYSKYDFEIETKDLLNKE